MSMKTGAGAPATEITEKMVERGVAALQLNIIDGEIGTGSLDEVVIDVFREMVRAAPKGNTRAPSRLAPRR
jgi:RecA/RadA recombinase